MWNKGDRTGGSKQDRQARRPTQEEGEEEEASHARHCRGKNTAIKILHYFESYPKKGHSEWI